VRPPCKLQKKIEERFEDFPALLTKLQDDVGAGTIHPSEACEKAKAGLCERINAALDTTIGFGRPRRHPSSRSPFIRTRAVKDAVKERDSAAADLLNVSTTDPLNTDAIASAHEQVKETHASLKAAVTDARQRHTDRLIADIDSCKRSNDGKGMWKALKALAGSHDNTRSGPAALHDPNGAGLVTDASTHYRNGDFDADHRATIEAQVKEFLEQTSFTEDGPTGQSKPILAE
jgi:hypothetical protein